MGNFASSTKPVSLVGLSDVCVHSQSAWLCKTEPVMADLTMAACSQPLAGTYERGFQEGPHSFL